MWVPILPDIHTQDMFEIRSFIPAMEWAGAPREGAFISDISTSNRPLKDVTYPTLGRHGWLRMSAVHKAFQKEVT